MRPNKLTLHNDFFGGIIMVLIFFLLVLNSCASDDARTQSLLLQHSTAATANQETDKLNSQLVQKSVEVGKKISSADYKIGSEDLLEIEVFQVTELKTTARVSAQGYIKLAIIDKIEAGGLTVSQLESLIAQRLSKYVKEPVVSVFVKEYRSQQISVLGAVKDPRVYYVAGQKYLLDMLSLSGGLAPDAGSVCIVQTRSPQTGAEEKLVIDLDSLLMNGITELNIPVFGGDVIQVPKRGIFFVDGAVAGPGQFQLANKTTLTQAISMAKGMSFEASHSNIKIYRDTGKPERDILTTDYDAILQGKIVDCDIQDKDIIIVSKNGFKSFIKSFSGWLNMGSFSLGGRGF